MRCTAPRRSCRRFALPALVVAPLLLAFAGAAAMFADEAAAVPSLDVVRARMESGDYVAAAELAAETAAALEAAGERDTAEYLEATRLRVDALSRSGRSADAETRALVALMLELVGRVELDPVAASEVHRTAGAVAGRAGDPGRSIAHFERALAVAEAGLPTGHRVVAQLRGNLSISLRRAGDLDRAREHGEAAAAVCDVDPFRSCYTIYLALAQTYRLSGELDRAASSYDAAVDAAESVLAAGHPHLAVVRHGVSLVAVERGEYDVARDALERVVEDLRETSGARSRRLADAQYSLGRIYRLLGDLNRAEAIQREALAIREETLDPEAETIGYSHSELGSVLEGLDRKEEACGAYRSAIRIFESRFEEDSGELAIIAMNVARCDAREGRLAEARHRIRRWARFARTSVASPRAISSVGSTNGDLALAEDRLEDAVAAFRDAVEVVEARLGVEHPLLTRPLEGLARAYWRSGRTGEALACARRAEGVIQAFARDTLLGLTEAESRAFVTSLSRTDWVPWSGLVHGSAESRPWLEAAWSWTLGRRGMVFDNAALRQRMSRTRDDLAEAWRDVVATRERLAAQWVAIGEDADLDDREARIEEALAARERAERELASRSRAFRRRIDDARVTIDEIARSLPETHVLVEVVRAPVREPDSDRTVSVDVALILRPDGSMDHAVLGPSETIDRAVARWRQALASSYRARRDAGAFAAGSRVRELVWDPIADRLRDANVVLFVPEAALHQVPMGALPMAAGGRFVMETGPRIHVLGTARDVVRFARAKDRPHGEGLLALADPVFRSVRDRDGSSVRSASSCDAIPTAPEPLPASAVEVSRIRELFGAGEPVDVLVGTAAAESRLRAAAKGRRIVHLATHGYFVREDCAPDAGVDRAPLLRSGLLVSPEPGGDGVLTAEELALLDLDGTELVVLSACDTGLGEIAIGEGVYGLRRAFELAGAETVVMSLWSVPDRQALKWMTVFYRGVLVGEASGEAARSASLHLLAELRRNRRTTHPWLWAGFVTAGDWR